MRQRRRAERSHFAPARDRSQPAPTRRDVEGRQRKLLLAGAGVVLLVIVGLLSYGWFTTSYQPPRKVAVTAGSEEITLRDLSVYTLLDATATGTADPRTSLNGMMRDALLRQRAGDLGVSVPPEEIDQAIALRFEPVPPDATDIFFLPERLSDLGRDAFDNFLVVLGVDEDAYRRWIQGGLLLGAVSRHFEEQQPETAEQYFVHWIVTQSSVGARDALERIEAGESFAAVATDLNQETALAAANGEVGWVPRGAIPELDAVIFDGELAPNQPTGPLTTTLGSMILQVTDGPSEESLSDVMAQLTAGGELQTWVDARAAEERGEVDLDVDDINWVLEHLG